MTRALLVYPEFRSASFWNYRETCELVDARYPMEELNSRLGLGINESGEYDSVGGYVVASLGTIPAPGAQFQGGRAKWKVEQARSNRVEQVRLVSPEPWPDDVLVEAGFQPPTRRSSVEADGFLDEHR